MKYDDNETHINEKKIHYIEVIAIQLKRKRNQSLPCRIGGQVLLHETNIFVCTVLNKHTSLCFYTIEIDIP